VNDRFRLVDLPGYGFAVGPERERRAWGPLVEGYLRERETLRGVVLIVDVRRGLEAEEIELLAFLAEIGRPAVLAATKTDKLAHAAALRAVGKLESTCSGRVRVIGVSGRTHAGLDELWAAMSTWIASGPSASDR
jgi:GTP-binding protein